MPKTFSVTKGTGGGGSTPTLQEVLTEGSTLTGDNTVDAGQHLLYFTNNLQFNAEGGDHAFTNAASYLQVDANGFQTYSQDNGNVNNTILILSPTSATINKNNAGAKEIATDLQSAITNGAVLTGDNTIDTDGFDFNIISGDGGFLLGSGDPTYTNEESEVSISKSAVSVYSQDAAAANTLQMDITPLAATLRVNGGTAKPIATGTSGTYTPTLTGVTNVTSSTARSCQYIRIGDIVNFSGSLDVTTTLAIATEVDISLAIASDFGTVYDANGVGVASSAIATNAYIDADATNDRLRLKFIGLSVGGAGTIYFSGSYTVL